MLWTAILCSSLATFQPLSTQLSVLSVSPAANASVGLGAPIVVDFDRPVDPASFTAGPYRFRVFGKCTGPASGALSFENGGQRLRFVPDDPFAAGEDVLVTLSRDVRGLDGSPLRSAGYAWGFTTLTHRAVLDFDPVDGMNVRTNPSTLVRIYGGLGTDFDDDGYLDLAVIQENSSDLRFLRNRADGTGHFAPHIAPSPVGSTPSPSEPADFDGDGTIDVVTCNIAGGSVSILIGNGNGTFDPRVDYAVAGTPRGVAVFDVDGDGDTDVVTSNWTDGTGNVAVLRNNGAGVLAAPTFFEAGANAEWGLGSADMNGDGIFDLVIGCRESTRMIVELGNGDGTFQQSFLGPAGGRVWKLALGDVNGDGKVDVVAANGTSNSFSVLLGNGTGGLSAATVASCPLFVTAPDLGDLDGDGDLDLVLSCFSGHVWNLYLNDGSGAFTFLRNFPALNSPACSVMMDIDNDRDLDLVLLDELADVVRILENAELAESLFCFGDGSGAACPCPDFGDPGHGCENSASTGGVNVAPANFTPIGNGAGAVELIADGFNPAASPTVIVFRSRALANNGLGQPLADGLMCLGSPVTRLGQTLASQGAATFLVRHRAGPGLFHYQMIYRDQGSFCTPSVFNLSNGVSLVWD